MDSQVTVFSSVGMILKWGFTETDKVDFYMEIQQSSWMSIGIGSGMSDADVFYTEINGSVLKLIDGYLDGYHNPDVDSQNDLILLGYSVSDSLTKVKFQRALDTGDSKDKVLVIDNDYTFIAAYTQADSVQGHAGSQAVIFDVTLTGEFVGTAKPLQIPTTHYLHVYTLLIAWGILVDVGIGIAQHMKTWKWYQWAHAIIFIIVDLITVIFVILKMANGRGGNSNMFHPGGNYIFSKIYGREIDRFFFGGYALEGDIRKSYEHTPKAELFALKNIIGELKLSENQLILKYISKDLKFDCTHYQSWHINQIKDYTKTTYFINLQNNKFRVKNYMQGIDWLGKYFQVKLGNNDKRRLYTVVNCLNKVNSEFRKQLLQLVLAEFEDAKIEKMPEYSDELQLCIKKYNPDRKTLSSILYSSQNQQLYVKGPLGMGLQLSNLDQGKIVIVAGGTGVLPFLDLLNLMLQKVIYEIAKKEKGQQFADEQIDFIGAFVNEQEFYGKEIIIPLAQLSQKYNLDYFTNSIRIKTDQTMPGINIEKQIQLSKIDKQNRILLNCNNEQVDINGICTDNDLDDSYMQANVQIFDNVGMTLKWGFSVDDKVDFYIEIEQSSWMSFGIGENMNDADVFIIEINGNIIELSDGSLSGHHAPNIDSQNDLDLLGYSISDSKTQVKFQRAFETGDSNDKDLKKDEKYTFIAAYTDSKSLEQHGGSQTAIFDIELSVDFQANVENYQTEHRLHVYFLLFSWGILADFGIIIAQHFKTWKWYQWAHAVAFFIVDASTVLFVLLKIFNHVDSEGRGFVANLHGILGFLFLIMIILQHLFGGFIKLGNQRFKGRQDYIGTFQRSHKYIGYVLYCIGKLLIILGGISNDKYEDSGHTFLLITLIIVIVSVTGQIISQVYYVKNQQKLKSYIALQESMHNSIKENKYEKLVQLISEGMSSKQINEKLGSEFKYCMLGNKVILLNNLAHPGGNYIFNQICGREIDRFFFGNYQLEGDNRQPYLHTPKAEIFALKQAVGELYFTKNQNILQNKNKDSNFIGNQFVSWNIKKINDYTKTVFLVNLDNNNYQVNNYLEGIDWLGKYFQVKIDGNDKRRLYTVVNCLNKDNTVFRNQLVEFAFDNFSNGDVQKMPEFSNELTLCIKRYEPQGKTLSSIIYQNEGNYLYVKGVCGLGLQLSNIGAGKIYIIAGGTGVLPFLDLLNLMLQKVIFEIAVKEKGVQFANQNIDIHQIGLEKMFNDVQIELIASFVNEGEFYGKDIIVPLAQLCQKHNLSYFTNKIRVKSTQKIEGINIEKRRFEKQFFFEQKQQLQEAQKIFICGPPILNKNVPIALQGIVNQDAIIFI
ncbi:hypothetical protein PPERSA_11489 [Pseudocohnilembus persalinus]|uniref:DOMON domain-containing protein n=1 Tax=Pseudocohnilembus persalinus TaxID=266149 RepID=A0A0V0QWV2_PSEPJ|nr:hypothetical protein PPERSA_11489 [Pseudocohnilembus persalinus]|eukprot:KRX06844.1 hypothetical protein PPERSA_11489 [Pseudocohnilembus persalinus]